LDQFEYVINSIQFNSIQVVGGKASDKETARWVDNIKTDLGKIGWGDMD
jgi:hypothetical protein